MKTSYKRVGMAIQNFCNDTANYEWEMIRCPRVHGHEKEKPTLAMPAEMLAALSNHVADRTLIFGQNAEKVKTS